MNNQSNTGITINVRYKENGVDLQAIIRDALLSFMESAVLERGTVCIRE